MLSVAAASIFSSVRSSVSSEMPFFPGAQWAVDYVRSGALGRIIEAKWGLVRARKPAKARHRNAHIYSR
jgi:hypothetical protein